MDLGLIMNTFNLSNLYTEMHADRPAEPLSGTIWHQRPVAKVTPQGVQEVKNGIKLQESGVMPVLDPAF